MAVSAIVVDTLNASDEGRWDDFVRSCPTALPQHRFGWSTVIARTYGFRVYYLVAKSGGDIVGIMPLFEVLSLIQGHHFTTLSGGVCATSDAAGLALVERAKALTIEHNAAFLAIRDSRRSWDAGLVTHQSEVSVFLDVSGGYEGVRKQLPQDVRQRLKQARASGVELRPAADHLDEFYRAFSSFTQSRGTPVFSKRFFVSLAEALPRDSIFLGAWVGDRLIGGSLKLPVGDTVHNFALFTVDEFLKLMPNYLMYWESLEFAWTNGYRRVDFGRSQIDSGQHRFKLRWGKHVQQVPIYQQFFLHRAKRSPFVASDASDGSERLATRLWQRLPLPLTQIVGPVIRRQLPFV